MYRPVLAVYITLGFTMLSMDILAKYTLGDWIYGVVASLIAAALFAAIVFSLR